VASNAFSRAKTPWCYAEDLISFDGPELTREPPEPRRREWVQDGNGQVVWIKEKTPANRPGLVPDHPPSPNE